MQFGFRFQILLFTTSERFSTKTLAYLAYKAFKAFMAFKRSRLNPFQNYRSITSFSVDWPRTIRLVYASVSILSVCAIMLQVIVIQTRWNTKRPTKEFYKQKSRGLSCDPVLRAQWPLGTIAQFFHFVAEEKKKRRQKNKGILWQGYHRYPSKKIVEWILTCHLQK